MRASSCCRFYTDDAALRHPRTATRLGSLLAVVAQVPLNTGGARQIARDMLVLGTSTRKHGKHFARLGKLLGVKSSAKSMRDTLPIEAVRAWCPLHCARTAAHSSRTDDDARATSAAAAAAAVAATVESRRATAEKAGDASAAPDSDAGHHGDSGSQPSAASAGDVSDPSTTPQRALHRNRDGSSEASSVALLSDADDSRGRQSSNDSEGVGSARPASKSTVLTSSQRARLRRARSQGLNRAMLPDMRNTSSDAGDAVHEDEDPDTLGPPRRAVRSVSHTFQASSLPAADDSGHEGSGSQVDPPRHPVPSSPMPSRLLHMIGVGGGKT